ncbi:hypothetical protein BDQ12DRAFT_728012 [Crucibulum laeve]|uniref:Ricin B lectin domain-containing protein n=1 Tax=Crucibulum laeve TaxID=68775 RepID=A0A5C3LWJ7_9AGAR|nr:hypothetical protein BDQ12DRAFT_728012 [Crucibulum laeve]
MSLEPGTYLIKATTGHPLDILATAEGVNATVKLLPRIPSGQTWQVTSVRPGKAIIESYDPNSSYKLSLSYSTDDFNGSPITTQDNHPPLIWNIRNAEAPNEFILSPDIRLVGVDICATVKDDQMVIQPFPLEDPNRPTWEFIRIRVD